MRTMFRRMFWGLAPEGRFWLGLGLASLVFAAGMSFAVGLKMTMLHAGFLACLSIVTAFLPEAAYRAWNDRKPLAAVALSVCAVPLFMIEFGQHAAYTAGIRGVDITTAKIQNTKYDDTRNSVAEAKRSLEIARSRLERLENERKKLIDANAWAASATAHAMREALAQKQKLAAEESSKRRGGCGPLCRKYEAEAANLASKIAAVEAKETLDKQMKDISDKIAGTQEWLDNAKAKSASTEVKVSQAHEMNAFLSNAVAFFGFGALTPTAEIEKGTETTANLAIALAGTGLPALALFIAGLYRVREWVDEDVSRTVSRETVNARATVQPQSHAELTPAMGFIPQSTREIVTNDATIWANLAHRLEQVRAAKQITV